ncbi:MAG: YggS family pyridoxal phosphate-dependent enzyme [Clostridia bacterium]|nr:YggS family pyridoxal phosphate-dependent enzyme [Clostridia bacterium]
MIEERVKEILSEISAGNCFHEPVTLVAATKTRTAEEINRAIQAGVTDIGENRVQEFTAKYDEVQGARRHFIGRLQTNKVKYLIGKTCLIHSVDRGELAETISRLSLKARIVTDILLEVNLGEDSKGGYPLSEAFNAYERLCDTEGLRIRGFMAMLPLEASDEESGKLCNQMRALFEKARAQDENIKYLSMGMSGDYKLCLAHGSNMIRLGTTLFGERN